MKKYNLSKILALILVLAMIMTAFAGCGKKEEASASVDPNAEFTPGEVGSDCYAGRTLRILLDVGGGGNYYEPVAERMMELWPGLTVEVEYANASHDVLRTYILNNEAPDIFNINTGMLPPYEAIEQGIAAPINKIFDAPTMDGSKTLRENMNMAPFEMGHVGDNYYIMWDMAYLCGLWYDENFFTENNLKVPASWEDVQELAAQCEALGMDLIGSAGLMPHEYAAQYWFWPMVQSIDYETFTRLSKLDYEAFKDEGMQEVVEKLVWLRDNGHYNTNSIGLGNAETQMSYIAHDFALLPCGSWLEAEMADAWTEDWNLKFLPYSFGNADSDPYLCSIALCSMVSATTENMDLVTEFYRVLFSDEQALKDACAIHGNIFTVNGFGDICDEYLLPSVKDAVTKSETMVPDSNVINNWYPSTANELGNMLMALMGGDIDGDTFMQRGYDLFKGLAEDDTVTKY